MSDHDYARSRLRGTVWERVSSAAILYRVVLSTGRALGRAGISANSLTYLSLLLALAAGVAAAGGHVLWAAALVAVSGAADALDGVVARATCSVSRWGALLDSTVDRLADAFPLLGLMLFYVDHGPLAGIPAVAMVGAFSVSYVRARAEGLGVELPPLFMRRAERVLMLLCSLLLGAIPLQAPIPAPLLLLGVSVIGLLNVVGIVGALRAARHALISADQPTSAE